ncbi:MAG TPA: hypothetical protein VFS08_20245, partial [Gemmatimonadaceae bacterium]|nr:hypothetical protein [Gemmatimonadaceae bacterium]
YLSNAYRWPEIFRSNRDVVENPNLIYPGERLRIPGAPADAVARAAGQPAAPAAPATPGANVVAIAPHPLGEDVAPRMDSVDDELARAARRLADFVAAPYVGERGGPAGAGRVLSTASSLGDIESRLVMLGDPVRLTLPRGVTPEVGARLLVFELGDEIGGGQLVHPTGIVQITEYEGADVRGRVVAALGLIESGQRLTSLPEPPAERSGASAAGAARVAWVENRSVLPALQDWLFLTPAGGAAVREGDVVELLGPADDEAVTEPEVLGTAHVVRVTARGASAIITDVRQPGIGIGTQARILASGR